MIRAILKSGDCRPQLCCDVCLLPIEVIGLGMCVWFQNLDREGQSTAMYIAHKGSCDERIQGQYGRIDGGWHELNYAFSLFMETCQLRPSNM